MGDELPRRRESWISLLSPSSSLSLSSSSSSAVSDGLVLSSISIPPLWESREPRANDSGISKDQDWAIDDGKVSDEDEEVEVEVDVDEDEDASGEEYEDETGNRAGG